MKKDLFSLFQSKSIQEKWFRQRVKQWQGVENGADIKCLVKHSFRETLYQIHILETLPSSPEEGERGLKLMPKERHLGKKRKEGRKKKAEKGEKGYQGEEMERKREDS